ncbi:hypothetical protein AGMMS49938_16130 [Fibrobacterales bacterium]|nr:hypothetical protein AGMMS49938_16130 [Fibrobacterales bacterium]
MKHCKSGITVVNLVITIVVLAVAAFVILMKIFSVGAQVRAVEVEQQVRTWNKLQVAFALNNERLGSFKDIAYVPPGKLRDEGEASKGSSFNYSSDLLNGKGRFLAINNTKMEKCRKYEGTWLAYANPENIMGNAVIELPIQKCAVLTPKFDVIDIH